MLTTYHFVGVPIVRNEVVCARSCLLLVNKAEVNVYVGIGICLQSKEEESENQEGEATKSHFLLTVISSPFIQTTTSPPTMNNVQAQQFAALQKATAAYQNDSKTADHMRRREGELMVRATEQQRQLEEQLRVAHGEVGEETRKQKNLEVERKRYKQAIEADRQAIVKITSELKGIEVSRSCVHLIILRQ